jgi:hypothetical protein
MIGFEKKRKLVKFFSINFTNIRFAREAEVFQANGANRVRQEVVRAAQVSVKAPFQGGFTRQGRTFVAVRFAQRDEKPRPLSENNLILMINFY